MRRSRDSRDSQRFDNKTRQVCALAERALTLALAEFDDPLLHSLQVAQVLPAPTIARLLVVVQPVVAVSGDKIERIVAALEAHRGFFRSELGAELNRKKTPELTFTIGTTEELAADDSDAPPVLVTPESSLQSSSAPFTAAAALVNANTRFPSHLAHPAKRERPRNEKRALKRQQRVAERRGAASSTPAPAVASLCDVTTHEGGVPVKTWTRGVPVEAEALTQLQQVAKLPIVSPWVAAMPDVHVGIGATVGSVIPTRGAIIPAAVGVDLGCGMMAVRTTLTASQLPDALYGVRSAIERAVPHGRGRHGGKGDVGSWNDVPEHVGQRWKALEPEYNRLAERHSAIRKANHAIHLGTLGTGNHFIELCLDESERVWVMLHSGSRGVGNRIGTYFIELAQRDMERHIRQLPHKDLAYFSEGSDHFYDYVRAVEWAQVYARTNRELMMKAVLTELRNYPGLAQFDVDKHAVDCHHNYVNREVHFGHELYVTRKGAVSAQAGELGIIPGSMGARSFIVRGKGNPDSLCSCSHGAGRRMSRTQARARFTVDEHTRATSGVECRKDRDVIDETPMAYKDIDAVMAAQRDLVDVEHILKQVVCVKG
jgi:tRNA-splicing ligase RtcB (3'-phosphate/5'-hydroxy nucleic acid ligase)